MVKNVSEESIAFIIRVDKDTISSEILAST
jgi:hypothetical protein